MNQTDCSTLMDLINGLSYGTKLHIGVLFFGNYGNEKIRVPVNNTIHKGHICDVFKSFPNGLARCRKCREAAITKALYTQKPFGGFCINGAYEYTRPVTENGEVICIIFIGNIYLDNPRKKNLENNLCVRDIPSAPILETMEPGFTYDKCENMGILLESYIRFLLTVSPESDTDLSYDPLLENLKNFIDSNPEYNITPAQLAQTFHYNEKYLGRLFKQKTGHSIREYSNMRRIEHACRLLTEGNDTVLSIALRLGFNNVTYFNRIFRSFCGVTPTQYRNSHAVLKS